MKLEEKEVKSRATVHTEKGRETNHGHRWREGEKGRRESTMQPVVGATGGAVLRPWLRILVRVGKSQLQDSFN